MNRLFRLWHRLWGRSDRDVYFLDCVIDIEDAVHDLGIWHLQKLNENSTSILRSKVKGIEHKMEHLIWVYDDLLVNDSEVSE